MKHLYVLLLVAFALQTRIVAQPDSPSGPEVVVPWTMSYYAGKGTGDLYFIDSLIGLTYNRFTGNFAFTTDGGGVWQERVHPPQFTLINSMCILSKDTLVAVRDSQFIFHSYDGGLTWQIQGSGFYTETFSNSHFFNHKYGVIFPAQGGIRLSSDLGQNWTDRPWNFGPIKKTPTYSNGYLFVLEESSTTGTGFLFSTDNGLTWEKVRVSTPAVRKVTKIHDGFFIICSDGICYKISPSGAVHASARSKVASYSIDYTYVSDDEIWCLDGNLWTGDYTRGLSRLSFNDTTSVRYRLDIMSNYVSKVIATTFDKVLIGESNATTGAITFHKFNDRRIKVDYLQFPGNAVAECLHFVNETTGFVATTSGRILKTTDGGLTWKTTNAPPFYRQITGFTQRSETEYLAAGLGGLVLRTTDGGENWQQEQTGTNLNINSITYAGPGKIFFTTPDSLYYTTQNWDSIKRVPLPLVNGNPKSVRFSHPMHGAVIVLSPDYQPRSYLYTTTNGGATWSSKSYSQTLLTYDPARYGIQYHPSNGISLVDSIGQSGIMSINGYHYRSQQNSEGNGIFVNELGSVILDLGDRNSWKLVRLGEAPVISSVFAAGNREAYIATNTGRLIKISRNDLPKTPSRIIRTTPAEGARFVQKNAEFKWDEPYSHAPVTGYHFQLAMGDTSNIIIDNSSITTTGFTPGLSSDTTYYFWRVRGKNMNGWGDFNKWQGFRSTTEILSFTTAQPHAGIGLTAAIKTPGGRYLTGAENATIIHSTSPSGPWTATNQIASKPVIKFYINPSNSVIYALNGSDEYFYSGNDGVSWTRKPKALGGAVINSLVFTSALKGFAAGSGGSIFKTTDGGNTWTSVRYSTVTSDYLVINAADTSIVIAVGKAGFFTISTDGGNTFSDRSLAYPETFTKFEIDEGKRLILRNTNGERRVSTDFGESWIYETLYLEGNLLDFVDRGGNAVIIDSLGRVYTKLATANDYYLQRLPGNGYGNGVEIAGDEVLIPGRSGKLFIAKLKSTSLGSTWQFVSNQTAASLRQYIFTGPKSFIGAGAAGRVMISLDQGRIWRQIPVPVTTTFNTLTKKADDEVVIAGDAGRVVIVKDGAYAGSGSGIDSLKSCVSVSFADKYTGYITCSDGTIYRSTDKGRSWSQLTFPDAVDPSLKITKIAAGADKIYVWLDSPGSGPESAGSELREYCPGFAGHRLIFSSAAAATGSVVVAPGKFFAMLQGNRITGGRGPALDTLFNLQLDTINPTAFFTSNGRNIWVGNGKGDLYLIDQSGSITSTLPSFASGGIGSILFSESGSGMVVSNTGNIYYGASPVEIISPEEPVGSPKDYALYQNYPNPFNPSTVIKFDISTPGIYRIELFSTTGELVSSLVDAPLEPGRYSVRFDATSLAGGVYFYRLSGNGTAITKKMIYLK